MVDLFNYFKVASSCVFWVTRTEWLAGCVLADVSISHTLCDRCTFLFSFSPKIVKLKCVPTTGRRLIYKVMVSCKILYSPKIFRLVIMHWFLIVKPRNPSVTVSEQQSTAARSTVSDPTAAGPSTSPTTASAHRCSSTPLHNPITPHRAPQGNDHGPAITDSHSLNSFAHAFRPVSTRIQPRLVPWETMA